MPVVGEDRPALAPPPGGFPTSTVSLVNTADSRPSMRPPIAGRCIAGGTLGRGRHDVSGPSVRRLTPGLEGE